VKKIVIIGPESTGKSTLCEELAVHYKTLWCPEYAREYLLKHGNKYNYDNLLTIAKGQIALEDEYIAKMNLSGSGLRTPDSRLLFIDTDMYVMKVWCEFVFGKCHSYILDQIAKRRYDLYLLCNTDLPWIKDELREYPDLKTREKLFQIYKDIMTGQEVPWIEISGNNEDRLLKAIDTIDLFLKN
jgi:NadR type nicotinamide-nucleotide adenylyltransferase